MHIDLHINEPCFVKSEFNTSVQSIDQCHPAQSKQEDLGQIFYYYNPSKLNELTEDNFKFNENGRWSSKRIQAISPFPTVFSRDLYCRHIKTRACLGKG